MAALRTHGSVKEGAVLVVEGCGALYYLASSTLKRAIVQAGGAAALLAMRHAHGDQSKVGEWAGYAIAELRKTKRER
eukprot:SAG11_NODE_1576_length_4658_cov_12.044747_3_plen_77_part_00